MPSTPTTIVVETNGVGYWRILGAVMADRYETADEGQLECAGPGQVVEKWPGSLFA